ncbi:hypothetical protein NC315_10695 [Streptomyces sp. G2]|uniref:hypothetical protein n=1 Tax=Streptomyces sp. G2 TaxID=1684471 RepID=UPI00202E513D|nr:hypothetical protein [Streptomyces sp. G2]MCM1945843.1 hypothetical protein [Streptomyces sp. G2]
MPYNYVTVQARSDLFAPATRAFGDILVIGKGTIGSAASAARPFTYPDDAVKAYPKGTTKLVEKVEAPVKTCSAGARFPVGTEVVIGKEDAAEVRTITAVADASGGKFTWTLDEDLKNPHAVDDPVAGLGLSDLAASISLAFRQTPPPTVVWGLAVDFTTPVWTTAFTAAKDVPAQIVVLANTPLNEQPATNHPVALLADHVAKVSNTGGDGNERIGVAMLDPTLTQAKQIALNKGAIHDNRMVLIAHKSEDDVAAAVAGVIAGHEPHISLLLKPISIEMTDLFTATEIQNYYDASINWVASPVLLPGHALYVGEGLTASPTGGKKYVDVVRTLDDIGFRVKAALIRAVGDVRIDRPGLRTIVTLVQSVLSPLVTRGVIEDYAIHIPLLVLLERVRATLTPDELQRISDGRSARNVDMEVSVVYAGVIHQIAVKLVLKG